MDARTTQNPYEAELAALVRVLASIVPKDISKTGRELRDVRTARVKVAEQYQALCVQQHYNNPNKGPSTEMLALEAELARFDDHIGRLRGKLNQARAEWKPIFLKTVQPHLSNANLALDHAADLIASAAALHAEADRFEASNGLSDGMPKSKQLEELAVHLRRFAKVRK